MKQTRGYLLLICIVSAMGGLLFGYDWVVIGGAKIFYEPFFGIENSAALRGWAMSSALIGCLAGALLSGIWSDKYGRKKMLVIASFLFALSAWGTGAVDHFSYFIFYRIVGALGIGIASNISPVYIAEGNVCPPNPGRTEPTHSISRQPAKQRMEIGLPPGNAQSTDHWNRSGHIPAMVRH